MNNTYVITFAKQTNKSDGLSSSPSRQTPVVPKPKKQKVGHGLEHYEIKQKIGQGSYGQVFLAVDKTTGKEVALKQMFKKDIKKKNKKCQVDNEKKNSKGSRNSKY